MFKIRSAITIAVVTTLSSALLVGVTTPASADPAPTKTLPGELNWRTDNRVVASDTTAEVFENDTSTDVRMWRRDGTNALVFAVTQASRIYPIESTNGVSSNTPSLIVANGRIWAFHRGQDNQIYYAMMTFATPSSGHFQFSNWTAIPGVTTSDTPVATEIDGDIYVAYRGITSNSIYTVHANSTELTLGAGNWVDNRFTGVTSAFAPGLTNFEGYLYLTYNVNGSLNVISRHGIQRAPGDVAWSSASPLYTGGPLLWGRPVIVASGNYMTVMSLAGDDNGQGRSIYRLSLRGTDTGGGAWVSEGWSSDPENRRAQHSLMAFAIYTGVTAYIYMTVVGTDLLQYTKRLIQR